ncbi:MAG: ketopantoate reductase family protein, partial [Gammaproteobacteria bacterium]|nr:ketopantoate reductase family protein [Gammaproteobacteria bacterium]
IDTNREHVDAVTRNGLKITGFGGERTVPMRITTDAYAVDDAAVVLFQCKAYGTRAAAQATAHLGAAGAVAISFQNGLGNEEEIAGVWGGDNVLGGVTAMAATLEAPGVVRDFSRVPSYIGEFPRGASERTTRIAAQFTEAGLETHASAGIVTDIWKKLLGNVSMSALSGATNLSSAAMLQIPELKPICLRALDEALAVARAVGIELQREAAVAGMQTISQPGGTGDNKSSLCVDLLNQRPTEVEFIYGSVIAHAREHGVPTPTLEVLHAIVKGLESHYL